MINYLSKWNVKGFCAGFIERMRKRLDKSDQNYTTSNSIDEVKRLVD
jgi:hypothetical protein